jgi:hypothetical protein
MLATNEWDMSQERAFIENLFCQRFNFFIVIFSLVIAGAASANTQPKLITLLWIGCYLCTLVALTLYRNWVKLNWVLRSLHANAAHPLTLTARGIEKLSYPILFGVNPIIGVVIPTSCSAILFAGAVLSSCGWFRAS